jgi:hypothetical protein
MSGTLTMCGVGTTGSDVGEPLGTGAGVGFDASRVHFICLTGVP